MLQKLEATFDGTALQPDAPLDLAPGTKVQIIIEDIVSDESPPPKSFLQTAQSLNLEGEPDWSEKIDQYLYGEIISSNE